MTLKVTGDASMAMAVTDCDASMVMAVTGCDASMAMAVKDCDASMVVAADNAAMKLSLVCMANVGSAWMVLGTNDGMILVTSEGYYLGITSED